MDVNFAQYRFQREQLTLYKGDGIIPLKHTQALLLDFFLADTDGIHSKETIMNAVWKDKVVSEQVVFQTISQLRALFGADAIKTFSKKGYQWQLALLPEISSNNETSSLVIEQTQTQTKPFRQPIGVAYAFVAVVVLIVLVALFSISRYLYQPTDINHKVALHLVQNQQTANLTKQTPNLTKQTISLTKQAILNNELFSVKLVAEVHSSRQSFSTPKLAWQLSTIPAQQWLVWTETFAAANGTFLQYGLSSGNRHWQGYVFANSGHQLAEKLSNRLSQLHQLGLFNKPTSELSLSSMISMLEISPNDPDLLLLLANYYAEVNQLEVAMTYAQKLENTANAYRFSPYRAKAQLLISNIYRKHRKYQLAANSLQKMSETLAETPLWPLKYQYINARAWVAKDLHDFETMFTILAQGIEFSQQYFSPLNLFKLHITYSILAKKAGDDHKKYAQLNAAQALLLKHKLNDSNLAVVYYHLVKFTNDNSKALPYLEKILRLPKTMDNAWVIDHATELLIEQYIEQKDFDLAKILLQKRPESPESLVLTAKLYHATDKHDEARSYFSKAFELSRLEHNAHMAVHAAFGLFQLNSHDPKIQAEYMDYLERNALKTWLSDQMKKAANN